MSQLFFQVSNFQTAASTPKISGIENLYDDVYEYEAYGHWIFDTAANSVLNDKVNGKKLTLQGATPDYATNGVLIQNTSGRALKSDFYSGVTNSFTYAAMLKSSVVAGSVISVFGDLALSSVTTESAFSGYIANALAVAGSRIAGTAQNLASTAPTLTADAYFAFAISVNKQTRTVSLSLMTDTTAYEFTKVLTGEITASTSPVSLGNSRFTTGNTTSNLTFAEFSIFAYAQSAAELTSLNKRMRSRAVKRGLI